jgi:ankyrin repeat protein
LILNTIFKTTLTFTNHLKKSLKRLVCIGFLLFSGAIFAGAYDDFFKAIELDQPRTLHGLLLRGFDPNTVAPDGAPALLKALQWPSYQAAMALARHPQVRVDARNARDETALMLAALRGQEELVVLLVSRGAAVNKTGWTPLHYAATGGHLRVSAFLIGAHADVNAEAPNGTTPLMMAAMYGNGQTVKLLLESGADPLVRNDQGLGAEDFAQRAGREEALKMIREVLQR